MIVIASRKRRLLRLAISVFLILEHLCYYKVYDILPLHLLITAISAYFVFSAVRIVFVSNCFFFAKQILPLKGPPQVRAFLLPLLKAVG